MDRSTLTVAGTNDTNMSYITRGLWGVTGVLLFVVFGWLLLIEVGGTPLSHLVPMIVPRGTLPRGGLGCAFGQCSFPHRIACDTDAWAWVGSLSSSIPLSLANVYPWPRHISSPMHSGMSIGHCSHCSSGSPLQIQSSEQLELGHALPQFGVIGNWVGGTLLSSVSVVSPDCSLPS
jgi:hypothetical protein